jgi:hypothetical protein
MPVPKRIVPVWDDRTCSPQELGRGQDGRDPGVNKSAAAAWRRRRQRRNLLPVAETNDESFLTRNLSQVSPATGQSGSAMHTQLPASPRLAPYDLQSAPANQNTS